LILSLSELGDTPHWLIFVEASKRNALMYK
jgi:hypothetical protein